MVGVAIMQEHGFFHPEHGYFQTISTPTNEQIADFPYGTISVPLKPGADYEWQDGEWVYIEPPEPPLPPLTARQLRLGLVSASILPAQVDAAIAAIPDESARAVAEIEWEYATQFERDHPLIEQVGIALGLSPEQIDAMWQAAMAA